LLEHLNFLFFHLWRKMAAVMVASERIEISRPRHCVSVSATSKEMHTLNFTNAISKRVSLVLFLHCSVMYHGYEIIVP
jgi:hypothetical protein